MATFAKDTNVAPERSLDEIRGTLKRYKANKFAMIEEDECVMMAFEMRNRRVRFVLPMPDRAESQFYYTNGGPHGKIGDFNEKAFDQAIRQRWRALALTIKAKLESVESGIETMDEAFMAQLVLADGRTMGQWAAPQVERLYGDQQQMPPMLASGQ